MSKFKKQNRLDEKAISVLSHFFINKYGDRFDLQFHGIKDNTPDTDGFLRLREPTEGKKMEGEYLNQVVFFQLKGYEKTIINNSYYCRKELIDFCKDINLPTILFIVGNIKENTEKQEAAEIYWYHFSSINIEILNELNKKNKRYSRIPNLELLKIGENDFVDNFYERIKDLAKKNEFLDLPKDFLNFMVDYKNKALNVASILYLIGRADKNDRSNIKKILKLTNKQLDIILDGLYHQKLIHKSNNAVIFKKIKDDFKRDVGLLLLYETISKIDLEKIFKIFTNHSQQVNILKNLSEVRHPIVFKYFKDQVANLSKHV